MTTVKAPERWYEVRQGRILFFADPSAPGVDKRGNVWAKPGQFIEASHPVLRRIVALQNQKLRMLKEGDTIPAGSIIQDAKANPYIKRLMDQHDGREEAGGTRTAEEIIVGDQGKSAPGLSPAPATTATPEADAAPESEPDTPPASPAAPVAPPAVDVTTVPQGTLGTLPTAPAAPPAPPPPVGDGTVGEPQTITEDDVGSAEDLGII